MIWIILFAILGICIASIIYFTLSKSPYVYLIIAECFIFVGVLIGINFPVPLDNCKEQVHTYKLINIANEYGLENRTYVLGEYNNKTGLYDYHFTIKDLEGAPNYGTLHIYTNDNYRTPFIEIYTYEKENLFWSLKSTDELTYSKICIPKDGLRYKEEE